MELRYALEKEELVYSFPDPTRAFTTTPGSLDRGPAAM
jgi:hypothetical protein